MSRFVEFVAAGAAAVLLSAGAAQADSRLFSARSDLTGVTVTGASLNGKELSVAGQGGGVTFFRIDNPGGPVPCAERIAFIGSNGLAMTADVDICANGAQVTVPFSTVSATPPPPAPPSRSAPPAPPAAADVQPVTIGLDDPNVTIDGVFMAGKPVAINRRLGNAVEVLVVPGPDGIACSRDLGLVLSDGRRIARAVDICANDWQVSIKLLSSGGTTTTSAPPPPPPTDTAPVSSDAVWMFTSTRDNGSLAFAVPNSDDSEFTAVCAPASNEVTVALGRSAAEVQPGRAVNVGFSAGSFAETYQATGSDVSQLSGLSNPLIALKTDDALWPTLIRESYLSVGIGSAAPYTLSLKGSAAKVRQFLAYCSPAPVVVPQPPQMQMPSPDSGAIPFACDDGSFINVVFDDANARVLVTEGGAGIGESLRRVASQRGARYVGNGDELVGYAETITWSRGGSYPATCRPR